MNDLISSTVLNCSNVPKTPVGKLFAIQEVSVFIVAVEPESSTDFRIKEVGKGTPINNNSSFRASDGL